MRFGVYAYQLNDIVKSIEPKLTSLFGYDKALKTFNEYYGDRSETQTWKNQYTGIFEGKNICPDCIRKLRGNLEEDDK